MRYSPAIYARSLFESLTSSSSSEHGLIVKNLLSTVKKNGDQSRIDAIAEAFQKLVIKSRGGRVVIIETARELKSLALEKLFKKEDMVRKVVSPGLVAGVRLEIDAEQELDYSLSRKLRNMFAK